MVEVFKDDEKGFAEWRDENPEGYVVNTNRIPVHSYARVHKAKCWTLHCLHKNMKGFTGMYIKACSEDLDEADEWTMRNAGRLPNRCAFCMEKA
jgi:hypothetical protein